MDLPRRDRMAQMKKVKWVYLRDCSLTPNPRTKKLEPNRTPVACVALLEDGESVKFALSVLNPLDSLKKSTARKVSATRVLTLPMMRKAGKVKVVKNGYTGDRIHYSLEDFGGVIPAENYNWLTLLNTVKANKNLPTRARQAAKRMLQHQKDSYDVAVEATRARLAIDREFEDREDIEG